MTSRCRRSSRPRSCLNNGYRVHGPFLACWNCVSSNEIETVTLTSLAIREWQLLEVGKLRNAEHEWLPSVHSRHRVLSSGDEYVLPMPIEILASGRTGAERKDQRLT